MRTPLARSLCPALFRQTQASSSEPHVLWRPRGALGAVAARLDDLLKERGVHNRILEKEALCGK